MGTYGLFCTNLGASRWRSLEGLSSGPAAVYSASGKFHRLAVERHLVELRSATVNLVKH